MSAIFTSDCAPTNRALPPKRTCVPAAIQTKAGGPRSTSRYHGHPARPLALVNRAASPGSFPQTRAVIIAARDGPYAPTAANTSAHQGGAEVSGNSNTTGAQRLHEITYTRIRNVVRSERLS